MKYNLGLVIWLGNGNYGTSLQAYALYKFLTDRGYTCKVIGRFNYRMFKFKGYVRWLLRILGIQSLRERRKIGRSTSVRKQTKLWKFNKEVYSTQYIDTPWQYKRLLKQKDVFCVGSDQVWNAYFNFSPFNFLDFADSKKRISYASSMGTKDFPEQYKDIIKELLLKFNHISLREETGRQAVQRLTGRTDVKKVLDPTFLLTANQWQNLSKGADIEFKAPDKYMLVYLIGDRENYSYQVADLKRKLGIETIIVIPAAENPNLKVEDAIIYRDAAVAEFIYLLENATWVCTDSFHATALSINLHKNFTEFLRFDDKDKTSQNSRIYDVLNTFGLHDRLYSSDDENCAMPIDYSKPSAILECLRKDSSDWLLNAIEN